MSWHFYLARSGNRVVIVDTGTDEFFLRPKGERARSWNIERSTSVPAALAEARVCPSDITDVVLTHWHWDHSDGLEHFSHAMVHTHRGEWDQLCASVDASRRARLRSMESAGRVNLFDAGPYVVAPGMVLEEAGRHTRHHVVAHIACTSGTVVVSGDAAYLFQNVEEAKPIACTDDAAQNLRDLMRLSGQVGAGRVLPGHDPAIFSRFARASANVAIIST